MWVLLRDGVQPFNQHQATSDKKIFDDGKVVGLSKTIQSHITLMYEDLEPKITTRTTHVGT